MADYYVDATSGSDSNAGTSTGAPWQTLNKVNITAFSAGDNIYFKYGETFRNNGVGYALRPGSSGSSGSPITYGAYGNPADGKPVIMASLDGADSGVWTNVSGNIYKSSALDYYSGAGVDFPTPAYSGDTPTRWDTNDGLVINSIDLGPDRDTLSGSDDWSLFSGNIWKFDRNWSAADGWTPDRLILDLTVGGTGAKKGSTGAMTSEGDWGIVSSVIYLHTGGNGDPDTAYSGITFADLSSDGNIATAHNGTDRHVYLVDAGGNPGTQYSYLELPEAQYAVSGNNADWIVLQDLDIRHGSRGVFLPSGSNNWVIQRCNIQQCSLDNIWLASTTAGSTISDTQTTAAGSVWQKFVHDLRSIGHGIFVTGSQNYTINDVESKMHAEDGIQLSASYSGTVTASNFDSDLMYEGNVDIKNGSFTCTGGTWNNNGGAGSQNNVIVHDSAAGETVTITGVTISNDDSATGDFFDVGVAATINLTNCFFNKKTATAKQLFVCDTASTVTFDACVFRQKGNENAITLSGSCDVTSTHCTYYADSDVTSAAMISLSGGGCQWVAQNDIYMAETTQLIDFVSGAAPAGTNFDNCLFERADQVTAWLDNNGSAIDEAEIVGGHTDGNLVIDAGAVNGDPGFNDKANGDYGITAGSLAASGGQTGSSVTSDIDGNPFDGADPEIGAYAVPPGGFPNVYYYRRSSIA